MDACRCPSKLQVYKGCIYNHCLLVQNYCDVKYASGIIILETAILFIAWPISHSNYGNNLISIKNRGDTKVGNMINV